MSFAFNHSLLKNAREGNSWTMGACLGVRETVHLHVILLTWAEGVPRPLPRFRGLPLHKVHLGLIPVGLSNAWIHLSFLLSPLHCHNEILDGRDLISPTACLRNSLSLMTEGEVTSSTPGKRKNATAEYV